MKRLLLCLCALSVLLAGCLFDPRDADPPSTEDPIEYLPRTSPRNVWTNCRLALENGDVTGWDNAIYESFLYEPDSQALAQYPGVFATPWDKEREMAFISTWFANDPLIQANLFDEEISTPDPSGNIALWDIIYYLVVTENGSQTRYRASARLVFELKGSYYYLTRWTDEGGESDPDDPQILLPTLGVVRGALGG